MVAMQVLNGLNPLSTKVGKLQACYDLPYSRATTEPLNCIPQTRKRLIKNLKKEELYVLSRVGFRTKFLSSINGFVG